MDLLESTIANHPFTKGLNPRFLHLLKECASFERFGANHQIFHENFDADRFYLIHCGEVALQTFVPTSGVTTIQTIGAGEALGWSWLYPPYRWHFSAMTLEPVEAVGFSAPSLRERMEENHEFGYQIGMRVSHVLLERLQATRLRLLEMYGVPR